MAVTRFITVCEASAQAFKTATLLKTLNVNALIMGEVGVGKKSLATFVLPHASIADASQHDELLATLESCSEIIITNLENSPNIKHLFEVIRANNVRVIATSKQTFMNEDIEELFSVRFDVVPLRDRPRDVDALIEMYESEAMNLFGGKKCLDREKFEADLSLNAKSLKRQVMINYLLSDVQESELMEIIEKYLQDKLGSNSDYRNFLHLYEVPIIKAGLKKFKSQLQLSDKLGLNRNTLRKKIAENTGYL